MGAAAGAELAVWGPFACTLLAVAAIDVRQRIVPNRILAPAAAWALAAGALVWPDRLAGCVLAGAAALAAMLLPAIVRPGGLGMGDVKLAGVMGLYLGPAVAPALALAFVTGAGCGAALVASRGRRALGVAVPFAPFMALGGLAVLVAGAAA